MKKIGNDIKELKEAIQELKNQPKLGEPALQASNSPGNAVAHRIIKPSESALTEIRIDGIAESSASKNIEHMEHDHAEITKVLSHLGESEVEVENIFRAGKFHPEKSRPRSLIVKFRNVWTVRKILAKASLLKNFGSAVFISKSLNESERRTERSILKKRRELIDSGVSASSLKIRNLKLYQDGEEVKSL